MDNRFTSVVCFYLNKENIILNDIINKIKDNKL